MGNIGAMLGLQNVTKRGLRLSQYRRAQLTAILAASLQNFSVHLAKSNIGI
jgi:hypothetical protein